MSANWVFVGTTAELLPGESRVVWDDDTPILVVNYDGDYYALQDRCSHEDFELSAGHFAVRDGRPLCAPAYEPVAKFPVKIEDGMVWTRDDRDAD